MIHPLASGFLRKKLLDAIPADDVVNKQRFVLFRIFSWSGTVVCIGTACKMLATIPEAGFLPWMILCLSLVMMVNYFAVQSFERLRLAYQVMLFSAFTLLHLVAYTCGGIRTGGMLYYGVIILYAYLMLGIGGGRLFTLLFCAQVIYFYFIARYTDWTSFAMFKNEVELINQDFLVNALFAFYLIASQGHYLQSGKNIIIQSLEKSKAELQKKNRQLEEKNELLKSYTRNLEKSNRELDKFASVASHDLKAPLRAIGTLSDFLEMDLETHLSEESRRHFSIIKGRVERMELLLEALLRYSKADRKALKWAPVNTEAVLEKALKQIQSKRDYHISVDQLLPEIHADEETLQLMFEILLDNALRFNDKDKVLVKIACEEREDEWIFSVSDNGPGIDPRYHEKIFVIFQTIQARDTFESTGAGLAIARKIIENKGGSIRVESEMGSGATFRFSVPKAKKPAAADFSPVVYDLN